MEQVPATMALLGRTLGAIDFKGAGLHPGDGS